MTDAEQAGTQLELGGLWPGSTYDVQVRAVNAGGSSDWSDSGAGQTFFPPTPTPAEGSTKPELLLAAIDDDAASLQNAVARTILEYGYGYQTEAVSGEGLQLLWKFGRGEANVHMTVQLPGYQVAWKEIVDEGRVSVLGPGVAAPAIQSAFFIPQYTADANPGLRAVEDLRRPEFQRLFTRPGTGGKAGLLTCVSWWECSRINERQVHGYGLEEVIQLVAPSSPEALYDEIRLAFENREDILFFYWWPSGLAATLETRFGGFYRLAEPPFTQSCFEHLAGTLTPEVTHACGYPDSESLIAVRKELEQSAPEVVAFLDTWQLDAPGMNALLALKERFQSREVSEREYREVAFHWLRTSDEWKAWVTEGIAEEVLAAVR